MIDTNEYVWEVPYKGSQNRDIIYNILRGAKMQERYEKSKGYVYIDTQVSSKTLLKNNSN